MKIILVLFLCCLFFWGCGGANNTLIQNSDSNTSLQDGNSSPVSEGVTDNNITRVSSIKIDGSSQNSNTENMPEISPSVSLVDKIQEILSKANSNYRGQGKLHEENGQIIAAEFPNCGLKDLSPLRGLKLQALDLSGNPVREIRHLRGMPLNRLFLEYTLVESLEELREANLVELRLNGSPVRSLAGLEGQPLENLYAVGTQINNISALANSNLRQLWLTESPVSDFSPLEGLPLLSLTAHRTLVEDLSFVRKLPVIQRLHIGETLIEDLTPLRGLNLTRLVFTPSRIKHGIEIVRGLSNLREVGTKFDDQGRDIMPPDAFWAQF